MSSVRGSSDPRGRGRGGRGSTPFGASRGRGSSFNRGGTVSSGTPSQRGRGASRGVFGQAVRGGPNPRARGQSHARGNTSTQTRLPATGSAQTQGNWQQRYQAVSCLAPVCADLWQRITRNSSPKLANENAPMRSSEVSLPIPINPAPSQMPSPP